MGFDPVTLALANEYTDKKFAEAGGSVVIDLDKYGIGQVLLGLFSQGGGETTIEDISPEGYQNFWAAVSREPTADLLLTLHTGGSLLVIRGVTKALAADDMRCTSLSFSFLISTEAGAHTLRAQIAKSGNNSTYIALKVS